MSQDTADHHSKHRAKHGGGEKGTDHGGVVAARKNAQQYRASHAPIAGFTHTDKGAGDEQGDEVAAQTTSDGCDPPDQGHGSHAPDPSPAIRQYGDRKAHHAHDQCHDSNQRAKLGVAQCPFGFQRRENRIDNLTRHVVRQHQAKGQKEHRQDVDARRRARVRLLDVIARHGHSHSDISRQFSASNWLLRCASARRQF
ncbi:hypothetical protein D3C84_570900 [compost metagenome]